MITVAVLDNQSTNKKQLGTKILAYQLLIVEREAVVVLDDQYIYH